MENNDVLKFESAELAAAALVDAMVQVMPGQWHDVIKNMALEKRIVRMVRRWADKDVPPVPIKMSLDWGYRCFVYPDEKSTEGELHRLLAWFVRNSGKKFTRFFREEGGTVTWWNTSQTDFKDDEGELSALFLIEKFPVGTCQIVIVEEIKTVKVKKLVCGGETKEVAEPSALPA